MIDRIFKLLGDKQADNLLSHTCTTISKERLKIPSPGFIDEVFLGSDRSPNVLRNLQWVFSHGRLMDTGYLSILPVDQGVEHSAGASFAPNPDYFDPENIVKLAIEAGCNAVASTLGVLGAVSRKYAHKIPFIVKFNHNELLTYPNRYDQIFFANVEQAFDLGAVGAGATIYFGSENEFFHGLNPDGTLKWKCQLGYGMNWTSAAILDDGTIYMGSMHSSPGFNGRLWALETESMGYASSPWPRFRHDNKNTGRFGAP